MRLRSDRKQPGLVLLAPTVQPAYHWKCSEDADASRSIRKCQKMQRFSSPGA